MIAHQQHSSASQPAISHINPHMQPAAHDQQMIASHSHHHHHHHQLNPQPGLPVQQQQQPSHNHQMQQQQDQYYVQPAAEQPAASQYQQRVSNISNPSADHHQLLSPVPYNDHHPHHNHHRQLTGAEPQLTLEGANGQQGQRFRHQQQTAGYNVVGQQHQQSQHQQYLQHNHQQASSQPVVVDHQVPQQQASYQRQPPPQHQQHYELMPQSGPQSQQPYGQQPQEPLVMHAQQQQMMHHQPPQQRPMAGNPRLGPQPPMMTQRISPYQSQQQPPVRQQQQALAATAPATPSHLRHQQPASNQLNGPMPHQQQHQYNKPHPQQQQMIVREPQIQGHSLMHSQNSSSGNNISNSVTDHQPMGGQFPQHHPNHLKQKPGHFMPVGGPQVGAGGGQVVYAPEPHQQHHNSHQASEQQHYLSNSPTLLQQQLNRQPSGQPARLGSGRLNGSPPSGTPGGYPPPPPAGPHQTSLAGPPMGKIRAGNGRFISSAENQIEPAPLAEPPAHHATQPPVGPGYRAAGPQSQAMGSRGEYYPAGAGPMGSNVRPSMHRGRPANQIQEPPMHHQMVLGGQQQHHTQHLLSNPTPPLTPNPNNPASQHHISGSMAMGPRTTNQPATMSPHPIIHQAGGNPVPGIGPAVDQAAAPNGQQNQWHQQAPMGEHLQQAPNNQQLAGYLANNKPGQQQDGIAPPPPPTRPMLMPKNQPSNSIMGQHQQPPTMACETGARMQMSGPMMQAPQVSDPQQQQHNQPTRLTLPLRDAPLLGPFRIDQDTPVTRKVFHLKPQLFDSLSKSMSLMNPQVATVVQELQLRCYPVIGGKSATGDSLLANNNAAGNNNNRPKQHSTCQWPDMFQFSVNQTIVHLDRNGKANHKPVDVFQFCQLGDNVIEIQFNGGFAGYEFVLEAVDRPTLKAFMNSCFKSRLLPVDNCVSKIKFNFGCPGFLAPSQFISHQQATTGIVNEYISEFHHGVEQTKTRVSLRCPISGRRMRTPARGQNCKHLQCFDLESFLFANSDKTRWSCPICQLPLPFTLLELDQHQMNILQAIYEQQGPSAADEILVDGAGQWQVYQPPMVVNQHQQPTSIAKTTGTYHPQAPVRAGQQPPTNLDSPQAPGRPLKAGSSSPAQWDSGEQIPFGQPIRRPASAMSQPPGGPGRRPSNSGSPHLSKRPFAGQQYPQQQQQNPPPTSNQYFNGPPANQSDSNQANKTGSSFASSSSMEDLSPLAAIERTIIQQMGPPPFDPDSLNASPAPNRGLANQGSSLISATGGSVGPQAQPVASSPSANHFSPAGGSHVATASPAGRMVPASPQQMQQHPPQSPIQQQLAMQTSVSTPATPSSSMLVHGGPETPATPSNSQQKQCAPTTAMGGHSPHVGVGCSSGGQFGVDQQPLSNGSASAGSITSSSTMTPSGQSLGSVGMGGDSRCGTAPLQTGTGLAGLDEMVNANGSPCGPSMAAGQSMLAHNQNHHHGQQHQQPGHQNHQQSQGQYGAQKLSSADHGHDELSSNDILMGKLMMDSSDMLLKDHRNGNDLALALEEAEWKQQLDKGKSEHLANFLNQEPMLKKSQQQQQQHQHQVHQPGAGSQHGQQHLNYNGQPQATDNSNKMLSGGLNPSDDEGANQSHGSSPGHHGVSIEQLEFANYLEADVGGEARAGLPPDDIILDLFER